MRTQLAGLELKYIADELKELDGSRVDQIYQTGKRELYLQVHVSGKGKKILHVLVPNVISLVEERKDSPQNVMGFCAFLRKRLAGARVESVEQKGFERVVEVKLTGKEGVFYLMIELFNKGNVVLCDGDYKVINAIEMHKWKDREITKGKKYGLVERDYNVLELKKEEFVKMLGESDRENIVKTLAIELGLGGMYAEEVCLVAGVDKSKKELDDKETDAVFSAIVEVVARKPKPTVYAKGETVPFEMKSLKGKKKNYASYNEAVAAEFNEEDIEKVKAESKAEEIERIIAEQEEKIKDMVGQIDANTAKAEFVYSKYNEVKEVLDEINKAKEKFTWDEIREKLKGHKVVKEINTKEKKVTVEL